MAQEKTVFKKRFMALLAKNLPEDSYFSELRTLSQSIFFTKPAPTLTEVIDYYLQFQAGCSSELKTCRSTFVGARQPKAQLGGTIEAPRHIVRSNLTQALKQNTSNERLLDSVTLICKAAYCPDTTSM